MRDSKPDLADWLHLRKLPDFSRATALGGFIAAILGLMILATVGAAGFALIRVYGEVFSNDGDSLRDMGYVLLGLLGAPFVAWRAIIAQKQANTAEQGLITDRINKAVEGLGAEKTVKRIVTQIDADGTERKDSEEETRPNIEVRIGAIYALERIAEDSQRDHIQVMEILCAYIRENAPASDAQTHDFGDVYLTRDMAPADRAKAKLERFGGHFIDGKAREWAQNLPTLRTDIQTALNALGLRTPNRIAYERASAHRGDSPYALDLRNSNLQCADLSHLNISNANLRGTHMDGARLVEAQIKTADLRSASLEGTDLSWAYLEGAFLAGAHMEGANLEGAHIEGAHLGWAHMEGTYLRSAQMEEAILINAHMERAQFIEAQIDGVNLKGAHMAGANLEGAHMDGVNLDGVQFSVTPSSDQEALRGAGLQNVNLSELDVTPEQLKQAFGDRSVTLPASFQGHYPDHWAQEPEPLEPLEPLDFRRRWRAFQREIGYLPPENP